MLAKLEGPIFGPYRCSNCKMKQPNDGPLHTNCIFCGCLFSNCEEKLIEEDAERFILHMREAKLRNESNLHRESTE